MGQHGETIYPEDAATRWRSELGAFVRDFGVNAIGGCCGTTPAHIAAFRAVVDELERANVRGRDPRAETAAVRRFGDDGRRARARRQPAA